MPISQAGIDFVVRHEGFVSKAYRDPVGIWTIGTGFTNGSAVARSMLGGIGPGKTITRAQNDRVLAEAFAKEYGPPAERALPGGHQHEIDAGCSYSFNCGPGAMSDSWTAIWRTGAKQAAADRLRISRTTAKGKPFEGLKKRRAAEASLLEFAYYGSGVPASSTPSPMPPRKPDEVLRAYQGKLADLGYYKGDIDGWHGPKTKAAVLAFQKNHPHLIDDGLLGPATRAQIDRDLAARTEVGGGGGAAVGAGGLAVWLAQNGHWLLAALVGLGIVALVAWFVLRRKEEVTHWAKNARRK